MTPLTIGFLLMAMLVGLVLLGLQIAYALFAVGFLGIWIIRRNIDLAFRMMELTAYSGIADYLIATIPLFVLMGLLVSVSNVGRDTFEVAEELLRRVLCGLGVATVAANIIFAAVTGVSIASAAVFTRVAVPEMTRHGYRPAFAAGTVAGRLVLGMSIPPSLLLIIYGVLAEVSIGGMFIAGLTPGMLLAIGFVAMLMGVSVLVPSFVYLDPKAARAKRLDRNGPKMSAVTMQGKLIPIVLLVFLVLGGLYSGFFTPTEAGGVGAFGAFVVAMIKGRLGLRQLGRILLETGQVTASITFLLIAAHMYSRLLALTGLPGAMADLLAVYNLGLLAILILYLIAIILLGTILDSASILLILVPLILPVVMPLGVDLVWFGIITIIAVEVGLLTPPLGVACFVIKSNLDDKRIGLTDIFAGAAPFALVMVFMTALVLIFPAIALFLIR